MARIRYLKMPWQKSYRKIPDAVMLKLENIEDDIQVMSSKTISYDDIEKGIYDHLGIRIMSGKIQFEEAVIPPKEAGINSRRNLEGKLNILRDLPKITKTYCVEVPNYGGWENGSHDMCQDRDVWQKRFESPKEFRILIDVIEDNTDSRSTTLKFSIEAINRRGDANFFEGLLCCINLLQENTGVSDIYSSEISEEEFLASLIVDWIILPTGSKENILEEIKKRYKHLDTRTIGEIQDRYEFWATLNPESYILDPTGLGRYFGARFSDDLVAFENIRYGNALYIMYDNWIELSKMSRLELLNRNENDFDRIIHRSGWKEKARRIILKKLE